jgi:hypothetical protein
MDRASLEQLLSQGLSLAEIGRRFELHESTVGYWLEFHHLVPSEKSFSLSYRGVARSLEKAKAEASKCVLLCANCHAEVEARFIVLTQQDSARVESDPSLGPSGVARSGVAQLADALDC